MIKSSFSDVKLSLPDLILLSVIIIKEQGEERQAKMCEELEKKDMTTK